MYITGNTKKRSRELLTAPPAVALNLTPSWKPLTSYQNWRGSSAGNTSPCSGYRISTRISCASLKTYHVPVARGSHFVATTYICLRQAEAILLYQLTCAWQSDGVFDSSSGIKTFNILHFCHWVRCSYAIKILFTSLCTVWFRFGLSKICVSYKNNISYAASKFDSLLWLK